MKDDNKRIRERVDFEIEARFIYNGISHLCTCGNISMGGVLLETESFIPVGEMGTVVIILNSGSKVLEVTGECRVVRVMPAANDRFEVGLEFQLLDSESSIVLYNMIRYQKV